MKKNPNINKYNKRLYSVQTNYDDCYCLPNMDYSKLNDSRKDHWKKQRKKYGFAEPETWALDYTASVWLYSHIKMMLDIGGKVVNFEWDWWDDKFRAKLKAVGVDTNKCHNDKDVFEYICELIEQSDKLDHEKVDLDAEDQALKLRQKAFRIFVIMMPRAWW